MKTKKTQPKKEIDNQDKPYFQEWLSSKVDPEIIDLNVQYLDSDYALEALLGNSLEKMGEGQKVPHSQQYATTSVASLLRKYEHIKEGGWWCAGVDVKDDFKDSDWGCFKPDAPRNLNGKLVKYETPPKRETEIFALKVPDGIYQKTANYWEIPKDNTINFWEWVKTRPVPLFITEGAKKAGALLSAGFPAIALPGINNGLRDRPHWDGETGKETIIKDLIPELKHFAKNGKEIVFVFDQDTKFKTQQNVAHAVIAMGTVFKKYGCEIHILEWDGKEAKGIDDLIFKKEETILSSLYENKTDLATYKQNKIRKVRKFETEVHFQDYLRELEIDKKLRFNELSLEMELDNEAFDSPEYFQSYFQDTYSCSVADKNFLRAVNYFARQQSYHPIREYLESLSQKVQPVSLDDLSSRYFGTKDEISNLKVKRWLIGAVARLFTTNAGIKFESALILYGAKQGRGKSSFFEALGQDWHCNDIDDVKGKDNLLKQHSSWILECAEFDGIVNKKDAAAIKAWIGIKVDRFREPYGTKTAPHPRRFAIAGTVNTVNLLKDETGNRRFWIIDTGGRTIDKNLLAQERDGIWLAAYQAYLAGEKYWFDVEDLEAVEESNHKFQEFDDWQGIVEGYLEDTELEIVSTNEILRDRFNILDNAPDYQRQANRLARILTKLKFERYRQFSTKIHDGEKWITIRPMYWVSQSLESALEAGKFEQIHPDTLLSELKAFRPESEAEETTPSRDIAANIAGVSTPVTEQVTELETPKEATIPSRDIAGVSNPVTEQVTEVSAMSEAKKTTKKIFFDIPEEQQQRIFLLEVIKAECDRLEWTEDDLKKSLKRSFPRKQGTKSLTNTELQDFWEFLATLKPKKELNGHGSS